MSSVQPEKGPLQGLLLLDRERKNPIVARERKDATYRRPCKGPICLESSDNWYRADNARFASLFTLSNHFTLLNLLRYTNTHGERSNKE